MTEKERESQEKQRKGRERKEKKTWTIENKRK